MLDESWEANLQARVVDVACSPRRQAAPPGDRRRHSVRQPAAAAACVHQANLLGRACLLQPRSERCKLCTERTVETVLPPAALQLSKVQAEALGRNALQPELLPVCACESQVAAEHAATTTSHPLIMVTPTHHIDSL